MDPSLQMIDLPSLKPPAGITPNYVDPPSHDRVLIAFHATCISLITIFLVMRLYTRHFINHWLTWDDYVCSFAYVLSVIWSGLYIQAQRQGFGRHLWDIRLIDFIGKGHLLEIIFVTQLLYIPAITVLKISLLLFFERVFFPDRIMKYLTRWGMAIVILFNIAIFLKSVWQCIPVQKTYQPTLPGKCGSGYVTPYVSGVFNVISDFYILLLPLPFIWKLKMNMRRKIRIMAVFSVGFFSCCTSIIRLAYTAVYVNSKDLTWNFWVLSLWSVLEVDIGIICACSLALPAFIDRYGPRLSLITLSSKIYSYFSDSHGSGAVRQGPGSNSQSFHMKRLSGSSLSVDLLQPKDQNEQDESNNRKDPTLGAKAFGDAARGDGPNLAFETIVEGGGRPGRDDVDPRGLEGHIMKRVDFFQTSPKPKTERIARDEEQGRL